MIYLNQISKLEAFLGSSPASNIQWSVAYIDMLPQEVSKVDVQRGSTFRSVSSATADVTICPYPGTKSSATTITTGIPAASSNIYYIKGYNPNAGAVTATVQINDGNDDIQIVVSIPAGGAVYYEDKEGWYSVNSDGARQTTVQTSVTGAFTPVDASGAGLVFTNNSGFFSISSGIVDVWGQALYPATADASAAKIGGLPFTIAAGTLSRSGFVVTDTDETTLAYILGIASSQTFALQSTLGVGVTNATMSGNQINFYGRYYL